MRRNTGLLLVVTFAVILIVTLLFALFPGNGARQLRLQLEKTVKNWKWRMIHCLSRLQK